MEGNRYILGRTKRVFDILVSVPLLVATAPLMTGLIIWSTLAFRANPIFRQQRVGKGGQHFEILKLRTLATNTPPNLGRDDLDACARPSRFAQLVRRTHLDELLQLVNVVVGQMSLVGPRPMIPKIVEYLDPEFERIRHSVRPGLTGLWQISDRGSRQLDPVDPLDIQYVQHAMFVDDVKITLRTAWLCLGVRGGIAEERFLDGLSVAVSTHHLSLQGEDEPIDLSEHGETEPLEIRLVEESTCRASAVPGPGRAR